MMRAHGCQRPIVVGEHGGPTLLAFPELESVVQETFMSAFAEAAGGPTNQSTEQLRERAVRDTPERRAMISLYGRMPALPTKPRMFLADCPPELEAARHRIHGRQVVMRTLLALAEGVRVTACWSLAPEVPGVADPYQMMHLLFGELSLLDYRDGVRDVRHPAADAFALLAAQLDGVHTVTRIEVTESPALYAFRVDRAARGPLVVLWEVGGGRLRLAVSVTPVFVSGTE
jgi:hypothetical protein